MHEVSLIENVLALVEQEQVMQKRTGQAFARVTLIKLRLGALGHAAPDALRFCFDAVTTGTIAEGSRLEIETIPGAGWCADCRDTVPLVERFAACPVCAGNRVTMTSGDDLRLVEMEVE
jgi:hydrogenase nickel incorporation protein HypA/HybF